MLFSIITVCRNDCKGIVNTYSSLRSQSFADYEWIVIDGNSTDGTKEWLCNLSMVHCHWVSEPDKGIYDAMNKGIARASGKYLIFMNSSDEFHNSGVLRDISNIVGRSGDLRFIYGDSVDIAEGGEQFYKTSKTPRHCWMGMFARHQAMFFINDKNIIFPLKYKLAADYAYVSLHLKECIDGNICYYNRPICKYKLGGISKKARYEALYEDYDIRRNIQNHGLLKCAVLFVLHFKLMLLKRYLPRLSRRLVYG